jgi:hypothetical protein
LPGDDELILRLLLAFFDFLPLIDRVARNDTASGKKRILPKLRLLNAFRSSIKQKAVRELECPPHQFDLSLPCLVLEDYRLERLRPKVIPLFVGKVIQADLDAEHFRYTLLVGRSLIATAHKGVALCKN